MTFSRLHPLFVFCCVLILMVQLHAAGIVTTIPLSGNAQALAINRRTQRIYVSDSSNAVTVIDAKTNTVTATIDGVSGSLAVDESANVIYANSYGALYVIDGSSNTLTATIFPSSFGGGGVAVNPALHSAYAVENEGDAPQVDVIDTRTNAQIATIQTLLGASGAAINQTTGYVFVASYYPGNSLTVIDGNTNQVVTTMLLPGAPSAFPDGTSVAVDPTLQRVYVTAVPNFGSAMVDVFDSSSLSFVRTVPGFNLPMADAVDAHTHQLYATTLLPGSNAPGVVHIDPKTLKKISSVQLPCSQTPATATVNPSDGEVYVGCGPDVFVVNL